MKFNPIEFSAMAEFRALDVYPRGEIFGYALYLVATDVEGNRVRKYIKTYGVNAEDRAIRVGEQQAKALQTRLDVLKKLPLGFETWEEYRPVYGSRAYETTEDDWDYRGEENY